LKNYLATSKQTEQYISLKPLAEPCKKGLKQSLPAIYNNNPAAVTRKTHRRDVIKTVKQYVITGSFKEQFKDQRADTGIHLVFLIDSSSSMMKDQQIARIKGIIGKTIEHHHRTSLRCAVIALQEGDARLISSFTGKVTEVLKDIEKLTTGGKTNMKAGLQLVRQQLKGDQYKKTCLYIFTDGKINAGDTGSPYREAIHYYKTFLKQLGAVNVIDTEHGFIKLRRSKDFANAIGATYHSFNA
jgi:magnesium chelatase subunit D